MPSLEESVAKLWQDHFEAHQLEEGEDDEASLLARTKRVVKEVQLLQIKNGLSELSVDQSSSKSSSDSISILRSLFLEQYVPFCLVSVEASNSGGELSPATLMEMAKRLLLLQATIAKELKFDEDLIQIATDASLAPADSVRALGCHLLACLPRQHAALMDRLTDKAILVRAAAIRASGALLASGQDKVDEESPYTELLEALLWNVWHDPSVPNRVAALQALPSGAQVWDHVIARMRDTKEKVRLAAIGVLQDKMTSLKDLTAEQFAEVIQNGVGGAGSSGLRCQATKDATTQLICAHWMKLAKFNVLNLLEAVDVKTNEEEAEQMIRVVMSVAADDDNQDILRSLSPPEKRAFQTCVTNHLVVIQEEEPGLTSEQYLLARVAVAVNENLLSKVAPDVGALGDMIQSVSVKEGEEALFACLQLLQLVTIAGMEEEGSRRRFTTLLQALLTTSPATEMPEELLEAAAKALLKLQDSADVADVLQDIVSHLTNLAVEEVELASLCTLRIISILAVVLEETSPSGFAMRDFLRQMAGILKDAISSNDDTLQEAAVGCLGKLGVFTDKDVVVKDFKPLLLSITADEKVQLSVRSQAMMALSDWSLAFEEILQTSESGVSFVEVLVSLLESKHSSVASIAAEATAKLLFAGRLCESSLISHLLVLFFDPDVKPSANTEIGSTTRMQQWLSLFFPAYCLQSELARDAVLGSIEATLKLGTKKKSFPLLKMVEYVCEVVIVAEEEAADVPQEEKDDQFERAEDQSQTALKVALQVSSFILFSLVDEESSGKKCVTLTQLRALCKLLGSLETVGPNSLLIKLREILEELGMILTDPSSLRSLAPLAQELADLEEEEEEELEEIAEFGSNVKGRESSDSTITEDPILLNKENKAQGTVDSKSRRSSVESQASSRVTRSALRASGNSA